MSFRDTFFVYGYKFFLWLWRTNYRKEIAATKEMGKTYPQLRVFMLHLLTNTETSIIHDALYNENFHPRRFRS